MQPQSHDTLYAHTMVLFWPWLWWQLFKLDLWMRASGRDVMFAVDRWGNLHVTAISDDPALWRPSPHPHAHQYYLSTRLPGEARDQWRLRLEATYAPGFGVQAWIISPRALGEVAAEICRAERPTIRDPVITQLHEIPGQIPRVSRNHRILLPDAKRRTGYTYCNQGALSPVHRTSEAIRNLLRPASPRHPWEALARDKTQTSQTLTQPAPCATHYA